MSNSPEVNRRYYEKNKQARVLKNAEVRARNKAFIDQLRSTTPCTDCGKIYPPYVMDFDHIGEDKTQHVSAMAQRNLVSIKRLQEEIDKCEIVCSNCHRERTHARRMGV